MTSGLDVGQGVYIYFGSGLIFVESALPKDELADFVTWNTEMACGASFEDLHPQLKTLVTHDLSMLKGVRLLKSKQCTTEPYFARQKTKNVWIANHGFAGQTFSETDIEDVSSIMELDITEYDLGACQRGLDHHFYLLPFVFSNTALETKYQSIDTTGWSECAKSTLASLKLEL